MKKEAIEIEHLLLKTSGEVFTEKGKRVSWTFSAGEGEAAGDSYGAL